MTFDPLTFVLGVLSGLIVGVILGRNTHQLALLRDRAARKVQADLDTLDRCIEIFNARADYVFSAAGAARYSPPVHVKRAAYNNVLQKHWHARPEVVVSADTWKIWEDAEKHAQDDTADIRERRERVKTARMQVLDWLAEHRKTLIT